MELAFNWNLLLNGIAPRFDAASGYSLFIDGRKLISDAYTKSIYSEKIIRTDQDSGIQLDRKLA